MVMSRAYSRKIKRVAWVLDRWGLDGELREAGYSPTSHFEHLWAKSELHVEVDPNYGIRYYYAPVDGNLYDVREVYQHDPSLWEIVVLPGWVKSGESPIPTSSTEYDQQQGWQIETATDERVWRSEQSSSDWYRLDQLDIPPALAEPHGGGDGGAGWQAVRVYRTTYDISERDRDLVALGDVTGLLQVPAASGWEAKLDQTLWIQGVRLNLRQLVPINPGEQTLFYKWVATYGEITQPPP